MLLQFRNGLLFMATGLLLLSFGAHAQSLEAQGPEGSGLDSAPHELSSIYGDATPSGNQILIRHEAERYCNGDGLCKIYGVTSETNIQWELTFSIGEGVQNNSQQNVYYIGGANPYGQNQDSRYAGAVLKISGPRTCETKIEIDYSVIRLIKTYMLNNIKADGKSARDFTEAEKTVMMFYGKIIEKAAVCQISR
ncbi:MAG: hypothetical protein IPK04_12000 [Bdellovibrionales bacterium]|nr:hypothetical protein [Bdellovibrionales bacterium]